MSDDDAPARREVAHRVFAAEYEDASITHREGDEERAPTYVITPSGAKANRLFFVGVLTEVEEVNEEMVRARVVDPTGAFVVYAGQYQPDERAFFERAEPPEFVAVTGKARTFQPEGSDRVFSSVRPESVSAVDADTRDRWVVDAARDTLGRVAAMATALNQGADEDPAAAGLDPVGGIALALSGYGTTGVYLDALRDLATDALRVVADDRDEVRPLAAAPDDRGAADLDALAAISVGDEPAAATGDAPATGTAESATGTAESATEAGGAGPETASGPDSATTAGGSDPATTPTEAGSETDPTAEAGGETEPTGEAGSETEPPEVEAGSGSGSTDEPATETGADAATGTGDPAAGATDEPDPSESATEAEAGSATGTETGSTGDGEPGSATGTEAGSTGGTEGGSTGDGEPGSTGGTEGGSPAADDGPGEFEPGDLTADADANGGGDVEEADLDVETDEMYELDEDERREVEEEFGTEFSTGTQVDSPDEDADRARPDEDADEGAAGAGSAGSEPAAPDESEADPAEEGSGAEPPEADAEPANEPEPAGDEGPADDAGPANEPEPTGDEGSADDAESAGETEPTAEDEAAGDPADVLMEHMRELDDGSGADRGELVAAVAEATGASEAEVEDAIQDALMGGQCYEPDDDTLKPI